MNDWLGHTIVRIVVSIVFIFAALSIIVFFIKLISIAIKGG